MAVTPIYGKQLQLDFTGVSQSGKKSFHCAKAASMEWKLEFAKPL